MQRSKLNWLVSGVVAVIAALAAGKAQWVCKVSGEPLGSMGAPIKVTGGDRSAFLCCQGCVKRIQANPDRYFGAG
jgi:hypothetical protein